ncbi:probable magnesium transporter NIPA9 isoform X3 [Durio zibethinus]|uniref:Probable magnesium transporter n=1 Tax=Durio zibethinus TaxID=66656 RepID=A0A6P5ZQ51_DURZI|nr:probable magnesium transporter NIPA9 isoform X3 [Durio zibethinus]
MWESICLTLAATAGNNIGKVLQKKGTVILPPLSFKLKVIRAYAVNKSWVIGFLMDICGALLMLRALSLAPVSVIQPVSGCGLAILSVFSHFYLQEVMNVIDWMGITLAGIGTIGVGAGGEEQEASSVSILQLPWLAFVVVIVFVLLNGWLRICKRQRREQELVEYEVVEEIIYGLESGILFGMASVISKMGFVFVEQGFSKMLIPLCVSISICCSGTGFYYQVIYHDGRHFACEFNKTDATPSTAIAEFNTMCSGPEFQSQAIRVSSSQGSQSKCCCPGNSIASSDTNTS